MRNKLQKTFSAVLFILIVCISFNFITKNEVRIFMIGDSTMADKPLADNPERGWGQMFPLFFNTNIEIKNFAKNGRSTKSFIDEGLWNTVEKQLKPGDYVFIQFGHNDEKKYDSTRYTDQETTYKENLLKFVNESRNKGAIPILLTPVNRRKFDDKNAIVETHKEYSNSVRELAEEQKVLFIDLDKKSKVLFDKIGPEETKNLFLWVPAGKYKRLPEGKEDNTHFNQNGAITVADLVVNGIRDLKLPLTTYLNSENAVKEIILNGEDKVIALDYYFNHELRKNKEGKEEQFHYTWEDEENSGFSILGRIITNIDGKLTELDERPTEENLKNVSVYVIVDPDTKAENPIPNYIEADDIKNIVEWVRNGGVLALFANDKGNCEFEHLNKLSEEFGIHFNEDSRNMVKGKEFEMGKFDKFPNHPIFAGIKQIYLKEISTLKLKEPAVPILSDKNDIIMASAKFGKGFVFAVGDPWLYNEYIDNRKLPEEYDNYTAARNLFYWLLSKAEKFNY